MSEKNNKLSIFFITSEVPSLSKGSSVRSYYLLKELVMRGWNIKLFSLFDSKTIDTANKLRKEFGIEVHLSRWKHFSFLKSLFVIIKDRSIPYVAEFKESGLDSILHKEFKKNKPDIIQFESLNAYIAIKNIIDKLRGSGIKIILDMHDAEYPAFREAINTFSFPKKIIGYYLLTNFRKLEIEALKKTDYLFSCSNVDKEYFINFISQNKISVVPNGVDDKCFKISKSQAYEYTILFMGQFSYPPNNDGMKVYFKEIHPKIKAKYKNITICLIGRSPPYWLKRLAKKDKNIIVTGFVKDVRSYIKKARICICPLRYGSGTRLKILEYMALAKPVVSTIKGAEGLNVKSYNNILIADNLEDFASKTIWLLENPKEAEIIGQKARKLVEEKYNWNKIVEDTKSIYESLAIK